MQHTDLYANAHLLVAAVRVLTHRKNAPPSIDEVCQSISFSLEHGNFLCNKLKEMEIIEIVEGAYGTRLFVRNYLKIEDIPRDNKASSLQEDLKKFQNSKKDFSRKIETFQAKQSQKKQSLFSEIEKKLKKEIDKK